MGSGIEISTRRSFLSAAAAAPACALACLKAPCLLAQGADVAEQVPHMFDTPVEQVPTLRESFASEFGPVIELAKSMQRRLGREPTLELLRKTAYDRMLAVGQRQAREAASRTLHAYTDQLTDPAAFRNRITMSVPRNAERAVELRVTECLWATTFLAADAGEIGYAFVCYGDYGWTKGFSSDFELVRTQTLMQGHDHCNHKYLWKG